MVLILLEAFLEVVCPVEWFIHPKSFFETLLLVVLLVEVVGVFEEQPAGSLQHVLLELVLGLSVEASPKIGELVVEEFHDVEMIEDDGSLRKVFHHCAPVGGDMSMATAWICAVE